MSQTQKDDQAYVDIEDIQFTDKEPQIQKQDTIEVNENLKFANLSGIGYCFFMKESFFFIFNNMLQRLPIIICSIFFNLRGTPHLIGVNDFVFLMMDVILSGLRDFQEIIPVVCGPYYAKNDFDSYRLNRNRLVFITVCGFAMFLWILPFLEPFYRLFGVQDESLPQVIALSRFYIVCYAPFMAFSNFLKGALANRRHHQSQAIPPLLPARQRLFVFGESSQRVFDRVPLEIYKFDGHFLLSRQIYLRN